MAERVPLERTSDAHWKGDGLASAAAAARVGGGGGLEEVSDFGGFPAVRTRVGIRICVGLPYSRITVLTLPPY